MSPPDAPPLRFGLSELRADLLGTQKRLMAEHHGFVRYRVLRRVFTLVADAEANQQMFLGKLGTYQRSLQHDNLAMVMGYGLICSEGETWRRQRRLMQPAFDRDLLERVVEITTRLMGEVLDEWEAARERGDTVEVYSDMQTLTMRVIGLALFSRDLRTTSNDFAETVRVGVEVVGLRNISPVALPLWLPIRLHRRFRRCVRAVNQFVYDRIEERLAGAGDYDDILSSLIRSYGDQAPAMKRELRDQVVTLFFAGFETTGTALAWTWLLLSENPGAQQAIRAEVDQVLGGRAPGYDDLKSLSYTGQVVEESLRLYPPVYSMTREAAADDQIAGHEISAGDNVVIPIHALHRMADYWEDPDTFCPERFAPDRLTREQRKAYIPFSAGQRKCMGANFATVEMLTALAVAAPRVRLGLAPGHPVEIAASVTQYPRHGLRMRVMPRAVQSDTVRTDTVRTDTVLALARGHRGPLRHARSRGPGPGGRVRALLLRRLRRSRGQHADPAHLGLRRRERAAADPDSVRRPDRLHLAYPRRPARRGDGGQPGSRPHLPGRRVRLRPARARPRRGLRDPQRDEHEPAPGARDDRLPRVRPRLRLRRPGLPRLRRRVLDLHPPPAALVPAAGCGTAG